MAHGNKGFGEMLTSTPVSGDSVGIRRPPLAGVLTSRDNALAALSNGTKVNRVHELVDPARCIIWEGHNRDYAALSQEACSDLIESFQAQGKQEVPAIVRRVKDRADIDFEVFGGQLVERAVGLQFGDGLVEHRGEIGTTNRITLRDETFFVQRGVEWQDFEMDRRGRARFEVVDESSGALATGG